MNERDLVDAFLQPGFYKHPVNSIELIETHISWVFLTGLFAYKVKKRVNFGFLNFTTLEQRKYYCHQELVLNSRFAAEIYLEVIPVTQQDDKLGLNGKGRIVDYTIKMKQFKQSCLFNHLLKKQQINLAHIEKLSHIIADFHAMISRSNPENNWASSEKVIEPIEENFAILSQLLDENESGVLHSLHNIMLSIYPLISPQLTERKRDGFIRECHGDLHLGNITLIKNTILLFDGIEFNESFRWIDTMSDCAFLIMDLQDHDQTLFAHHFLNHYLFKTGDYSGLQVLKFYLIYRSTVRAKVAALRLQQQKKDTPAYFSTASELRNYLQLAESYAQGYMNKTPIFMAISYGLSGSGKSWVCSKLSDPTNAILLRSDVERKRLFLKTEDDLYSQSITEKTYEHLIKIGQLIASSGYAVIVDATFLDKKWRTKFLGISEKLGIPFHILSCYAEPNVLKKRLILRQKDKDNVSDADVLVMEHQKNNRDLLTADEKKHEILIDTVKLSDYSTIITQLLHK